jgi:hypothetical protein
MTKTTNLPCAVLFPQFLCHWKAILDTHW